LKKEEIYDILQTNLKKSSVQIDEPMNKHTSFKIGGNADIFVTAKCIEDIVFSTKLAKENNIKIYILGNGSNVLVSDLGIRGIVLKICLDEINVEKQKDYAIIETAAGMPLGKLAQILLKNEIAGFEFASGIPGTIGGAVRMNAGAYGSEMKDIIENVTILDKNFNLRTLNNVECNFSYRKSYFTTNKAVIIKAKLKLKLGKYNEIKELMDGYLASRKEKQPLEYPSAGSTFKRGEDFITAKLIDECGLRGYKYGNAGVSTKHTGFIVNLGGATANDVLNVIKHVKNTVYEITGKIIECEIELLGEGIEK